MIEIGIILGILAAAVWGFMNVVDKYIVEAKIKSIMGFSLLCGLQNIIIGGIAAALISWENITWMDVMWASLSGALLAGNMIIYFKLLSKYDVSDILGLFYTYPVITAILSFIFLSERLTLSKYIAVIVIIAGVLVFNKYLKLRSIKFNLAIFIPYMLISAVYEIFAKLATASATPLQGAVLNSVSLGIFATLFLLPYYKKLKEEIVNTPYSVLSMAITYVAVFLSYASLMTIPATFLAAISASQPLFSLLFEKIASLFTKTITATITRDKIIGMLLIVFGVAILSL